MTLLRCRKQRRSKLVRIEEFEARVKKFGLIKTRESLNTVQARIRKMDAAADKKEAASAVIDAIGRAEITLAEEHEKIGESKTVKFRSRRGIVVSSILLACMAAVGHMIYNPPLFIRSLPHSIESNFRFIATGVIVALASIPVADILKTWRFGKVKKDTERFLLEIKDEAKNTMEGKQ